MSVLATYALTLLIREDPMHFHHILMVSEKALTARLGGRLALKRELGRSALTTCLGASLGLVDAHIDD